MTTPKSKTWAAAAIKKIAQSIAGASGLSLVYDTIYNPTINFIEQSETADVAFLQDICTKNGLALKVYSNKLIIYRESEYEKKKEIAVIGETDMISWQANFSETDTYDGCKVEYTDPDTDDKYSYTFQAPGRKGSKIYKENSSVKSIAEAERLAKAKLRELNKKEMTMSIELPGNVQMLASSTVGITGMGIFDGKYFIDKASHSIGSGYKTNLELHKVLEGY
jgi:phage protein D